MGAIDASRAFQSAAARTARTLEPDAWPRAQEHTPSTGRFPFFTGRRIDALFMPVARKRRLRALSSLRPTASVRPSPSRVRRPGGEEDRGIACMVLPFMRKGARNMRQRRSDLKSKRTCPTSADVGTAIGAGGRGGRGRHRSRYCRRCRSWRRSRAHRRLCTLR